MSTVQGTEPAVNAKLRSSIAWTLPDPLKPIGYCCEVRLSPDASGFTAYLPSLPGVVSEGDDEGSALRNVAEAAQTCFQAYLEQGADIPWIEPEDEFKPGEIRHRIAVHV